MRKEITRNLLAEMACFSGHITERRFGHACKDRSEEIWNGTREMDMDILKK